MNVQRRLAPLLLAAMIVSAIAADSPPDFTGTWKLNAAKGENLGMMAALQQTLKIEQTATALSIAETSDMQGQKSTRTVRYDLTGKATPNDAAMGGKAETVARWDGPRLVVTWTTPGSVAGSVSTRTETRSLSPDGRTMTVQSVRGGSTTKPVTMAFDKQ